jgi:hypothetical protein
MMCKISGCTNPVENLKIGLCATHAFEARKAERVKGKQPFKPKIKKVSDKMAKALAEYSKMKKEWIKGKRCAVFPEKWATDVHHKKGRVGYADWWARQNNIPLLIDIRFWLPVSREGHTKIENLKGWALEKGYSLPRNEKK